MIWAGRMPDKSRHIGRLVICLLAGLLMTGCVAPRPPVTHPPGTLRVAYERSESHTGCLVASAAMAANYLLARPEWTEKRLRDQMQAVGLDESKVADVKAFLGRQGLYVVTLSGTLDGNPPTGLGHWVRVRGYPVVCIINYQGEDPAYNHAVVVIGFSAKAGAEATDKVYYLDPSTDLPLHEVPAAGFEALWGPSGRAMLLVIQPPASP